MKNMHHAMGGGAGSAPLHAIQAPLRAQGGYGQVTAKVSKKRKKGEPTSAASASRLARFCASPPPPPAPAHWQPPAAPQLRHGRRRPAAA